MAIPDQAKFVLLVTLTVCCLRTIFYAPSTTMHSSSMKVLSPNVQMFCKPFRDAAADCRSRNEKGSCLRMEESVEKCNTSVKNAYQHINLGGCPFHIKAVTLCEDEWCRHDPNACESECSSVAEKLASCVQQHVYSYFQRNGLENNG